ncbi:hypothetical protein BDV59DRAFT_170248 [Aspergillus ambiguus]|uniref:uncharacterized protein n=1 Tax=Aspergillus ambiguus TaxID=176160 RepID=UPI003CCD1D3C
MFNASPGASEYDQMNGYGSFSDLGINKFQYYFDDVAVVPMLGYNFTRMEAGPYRLEWEYVVSPCTHEPPNTIVYNINQVVASGMHYFSVVEDGSGLDFDIPTNECPLYGDTWSVKDATYTYCPFLGDDTDVEKKPCDAKLQNSDQVECIKEFLFEGTAEVPNNRTETCSAFKRADPKWLEYEDENDDEDRGDEDGGDEDGGAADSSGSSTHDGNDDENSAGGLQLSMFSIAVAGILAIMEL